MSGTPSATLARRAHARISRSALLENLAALRGRTFPGTLVAPIIKANAYGHGRDAIAGVIARDADLLCVAEPIDALELAAIAAGRVLCLGPSYGAELDELRAAKVRITVSDFAAVHHLGPGDRVHLLVDTGLHRLGVSPDRTVDLAKAIRATGATLEGAFCHVAGADRGDWDSVEAEIRVLTSLPLGDVVLHTGGSGILLSRPDLVGGLARPGIALFGHVPRSDQVGIVELRPVLSLVAPILELRQANRDDRVGYSGTPLSRHTVIATLPIGVCHGLPPRLSDGGGWVSVAGQHCAILANPMLDYCLVDVTEIRGVAVCQVATLLGDAANGAPTVEETAGRLGLSSDHLLVGLHESLPRVICD